MLLLLGLLVGLGCLFFGGDWLVKGSSKLAESLGISPLVVGLTVVAFGTSTPELLVSVSAALGGSSDIAIGNVVGSNIANIGLILGLSGIIYPIGVQAGLLRREIPIMLVVALAAVLMIQDGIVNRSDASILLVGMFLFIVFMIISSLREQKQSTNGEPEDTNTPPINRMQEMGRLLVGIVVLMVGAQLTVGSATDIARNFGVSELLIGITLIAVGTSLPELVTSVVAAVNKESDIAIGNVVGSNIFNILGILSITALVKPIPVSQQIITVEALIMLGFSFLVLPFALDRKLGRLEAIVFLLGYIGFMAYAVYGAM